MKKTLLVMCVLILSCLSLVGCGGSSSVNNVKDKFEGNWYYVELKEGKCPRIEQIKVKKMAEGKYALAKWELMGNPSFFASSFEYQPRTVAHRYEFSNEKQTSIKNMTYHTMKYFYDSDKKTLLDDNDRAFIPLPSTGIPEEDIKKFYILSIEEAKKEDKNKKADSDYPTFEKCKNVINSANEKIDEEINIVEHSYKVETR